MGLHEWSLGGVLLSPMAIYAVLALLLTGALLGVASAPSVYARRFTVSSDVVFTFTCLAQLACWLRQAVTCARLST